MMPPKIRILLPYLLVLTAIIFLVIRTFIVISPSTDLAGIEQNVIYSIQTLLDSGKLYLSPSEPPFSITQYTPIYYYLCVFTAKIIGLVPDDVQALYYLGRTWNVLFNLIASYIVYLIGKNIFGISKLNSLTLSLVTFSFLFPHNFAARPDSLHDMLGIASIYRFLLLVKHDYIGNKATLQILIIVVLSALAVFTKQSGIQFVIIFGGFFLINRRWSALLKLSILTLVVYGAFLLGFRLIYHSFFENIIGGVANGLNVANFTDYVITKKIFVLVVWPLIIITLFILIKINALFRGRPEERALSICILGTLIFATATALKMGSTVQYYIVFASISLILATKYLNDKPVLVYLYFTLVLFASAAQNIKLLISFERDPNLANQRSAITKVAEYIRMDRVKNSERFVFSNLTTDYTIPSRQSINNVFFRECLIPQMDILQYSTGPSKVLNYEKFSELLQNGEVEYIIDSNPQSNFLILPDFDRIKKNNFKLVRKIDGYLIYKSLAQ